MRKLALLVVLAALLTDSVAKGAGYKTRPVYPGYGNWYPILDPGGSLHPYNGPDLQPFVQSPGAFLQYANLQYADLQYAYLYQDDVGNHEFDRPRRGNRGARNAGLAICHSAFVCHSSFVWAFRIISSTPSSAMLMGCASDFARSSSSRFGASLSSVHSLANLPPIISLTRLWCPWAFIASLISLGPRVSVPYWLVVE